MENPSKLTQAQRDEFCREFEKNVSFLLSDIVLKRIEEAKKLVLDMAQGKKSDKIGQTELDELEALLTADDGMTITGNAKLAAYAFVNKGLKRAVNSMDEAMDIVNKVSQLMPDEGPPKVTAREINELVSKLRARRPMRGFGGDN